MPIIQEANKETVGPGAMENMEMQRAEGKDSPVYPANKVDVQRAKTNAVKLIHSPKVKPVIVKHLQQNPELAMQSLSQLGVMVVQRIVGSIKGKTGRKVHKNLIRMMIEIFVREVNHLAQAVGKGKIPVQVAKMLRNNIFKILMTGGKQEGEMQGGMSPSPRGPQQGMAAGPPASPAPGPPQGIIQGGMQ